MENTQVNFNVKCNMQQLHVQYSLEHTHGQSYIASHVINTCARCLSFNHNTDEFQCDLYHILLFLTISLIFLMQIYAKLFEEASTVDKEYISSATCTFLTDSVRSRTQLRTQLKNIIAFNILTVFKLVLQVSM